MGAGQSQHIPRKCFTVRFFLDIFNRHGAPSRATNLASSISSRTTEKQGHSQVWWPAMRRGQEKLAQTILITHLFSLFRPLGAPSSLTPLSDSSTPTPHPLASTSAEWWCDGNVFKAYQFWEFIKCLDPAGRQGTRDELFNVLERRNGLLRSDSLLLPRGLRLHFT